MAVTLICCSSELVGVAVHVRTLGRLLASAGLLDVIVCPANGWLPAALEEDRLPFAVVPLSFSLRKGPSSAHRLYAFLKHRSSAILHFHGRLALLSGAPLIASSKKVRHVATVHQFSTLGRHGFCQWKQRAETLLLRQVHDVICVSEALRQDLRLRLGPSPQLHVIQNSIVPRGRRRHNVPPAHSSIRLCAIGRLAHEKGFDILVRACARLSNAGHRVTCDIFGVGPEEKHLQALLMQSGAADVVSLRGLSGDVRAQLPDYDILLAPSRTESFGLTILEAYDAGLPVIASDIPGLREIVVPGLTGNVFKSGSHEELAAAILALWHDPCLYERCGGSVGPYVSQFYPSDRLLARYLKMYGLS